MPGQFYTIRGVASIYRVGIIHDALLGSGNIFRGCFQQDNGRWTIIYCCAGFAATIPGIFEGLAGN